MPITKVIYVRFICNLLSQASLSYCQSGWSRSNDPIIKSDVLYQLSYRLSCAAIGVTQFFYRGPTSRLKFVFSLQLFFTGIAPIQYRRLSPANRFDYSSPRNWLSSDATAASVFQTCRADLYQRFRFVAAHQQHYCWITEFRCLGTHQDLVSWTATDLLVSCRG